MQGKYVDFEYVDEDGKVFTWSFPGTGSYKVSDILAHLNIRGTVESAELALIEGEYVEGALYLVQVRGEYYLNSQVAFDDTYRLTVVVDGKKYGIRVTDEQVNQGVTVDTYFITNEGRLQNAAADSGERLNGRVALTNSNPSGGDAYIRVDIDKDDKVQLRSYVVDGQRLPLTVQNSNGTSTTIYYTYHENGSGDPYIIYEVPAGATVIAELSFVTPNGTTPDGTSVKLTPSIVNSDGSSKPMAANDSVKGPAVGTWHAEFKWDDIQKTVNADTIHLNNNNTFSDKDWLRYNFSANTLNKGETGALWTDTVTLSDTLTLPAGMTFKAGMNLQVVQAETGWNLVDANNNNEIVFGLSGLSGFQIDSAPVISVSADRSSLTYTVNAKNPNRTGNTVTSEMNSFNYQGELSMSCMEMTSTFKENASKDDNYSNIVNTVGVTETSVCGDEEKSTSSATTRVKGNEGYELHKDSNKDGAHIKSGDTIHYTVTLTNTGSSPFTADNALVDTLPQEVELVLSSVTVTKGIEGKTYSVNGNQISYPAEGLPAGGEIVLEYDVTVKSADALMYTGEGTVISNNVQYRDAKTYTSSTLQKDHYDVQKDLVGSKGTDADPAVDGDIIYYSLTAKNDGDGEVHPVIMMDQLPAFLELQAFYPDNLGFNGGVTKDAAITDLNAYYQWYKYSGGPGSSDNYVPIRIKDSSGTLRDAKVYMNNGAATLYIDAGTLNARSNVTYGYGVKYVAANAGDNVDESGYAHYTNIVTTPNGDSDDAPFNGKYGKVGVEKQHDSNGTLNGVTVSGPTYRDGTILNYTINVNNDPQNPYTKTITVTDTLPVGMFPVVNNMTREQLNAALDNGQTSYTINGRAATVTRSGDIYTLTWSIENPVNGSYVTTQTITYPAQIDASLASLNAAGYAALQNTVVVPGSKDVDITELQEQGIEMDKIATATTAGEILHTRMVKIEKGSKVTYRLTLHNPSNRVIIAENVYDYFPYWTNMATLGQSDQWWDTNHVAFSGDFDKREHHAEANGNLNVLGNNKIEWGNLKLLPNETLTETITLEFPNKNELYNAMIVASNGNSKNTFHVGGLDDKIVDHTMDNDEKFMLQKSVVRLIKRDNHNNSSYTDNAYTLNSRDIYKRNDVNEVIYSVVLANTGSVPLHVDKFVDTLPASLELINILDPTQWGNQVAENLSGNTMSNFSNLYAYDMNILAQNNTTTVTSGGVDMNQVPITASGKTGNITFTLNGGAGIDIPYTHAVTFYFRCKIVGDALTDSSIDAITNSVQAVLDGSPEIKKTSLKEKQGAGGENTQNNGGCTIVDRSNGKTIAESSVTIHPLDVAVPGIEKKAATYGEWNNDEQKYGASEELPADHNKNISANSRVTWQIKLRNDGTQAIDGYTVTDTIPAIHKLVRKDHENAAAFVTGYVIYDGTGAVKSTIDTATDPVFTGAQISDDGKKATLTFPAGDKYVIPEGGYALMTLVSDFIDGQHQGRIENEAIFSPSQPDWDANLVTHGQLVKDESGENYTGVKAEDYVNAYGDMASSSYKKVQALDDATNCAYGYEAKNTITVPVDTTRVKYTLQVSNLSNSDMDKLVIIDHMPELGDTGVVNTSKTRDSEYSISFLGSLEVKVKSADGYTEQTLSAANGDYTVQYSTKTAFDDDDFNGTSTWSDSPEGAKSFRIVFDPAKVGAKLGVGGIVLPKEGGSATVEYIGRIGDDANPGETAYNSFAYRYTVKNSESSLTAEPPKVGVRIEPQPTLQKRVLDQDDQNLGSDETNLFEFKVYAGDASTKTPEELEQLTPVFTATVPQGGSVYLPKKQNVNGVEKGIFEDGQIYTVIETPKTGYYSDGYLVDGLKKSPTSLLVFTYNASQNTTIIAINKEDVSGFTPEARKTLRVKTGSTRVLQESEFSFDLVEYTDETFATVKNEGVNQNKLNDAEGKAVFDKIEYETAGTYYYRVTEHIPVTKDSTIVYDETVYDVIVTVDERGMATPTYKKPDGTVLPAGQVPQFVNTESTEIQVEKVWDGAAKSGEATMVLYRATSVPTDSFVVNVNAILSHNPVGSANITATFTGEGDTKTVVLNNGNSWSGQVALKRGVSYTVNYTTNKTDKIHFTSETEVSGITDPTTLTVNANAEAAQQYTYTFTVPGDKPANGKGSVDVTFNGQTKTLNSGNSWRVEFTDLPEESTYRYTVSGDNFITTVEPTSGEGTVSDNATINLTLTPAAQTMTVPVSVSWDGNTAPDSGDVTVTLTSASGTAQTVTLNAGNSWSGEFTDIPRLDDSGNLIEYTVSTNTNAESTSVSVATPSNGKISGEGTVVVNGVVASGMTINVYWDGKGGYAQVEGLAIPSSDWNSAGKDPEYYKSSVNTNKQGLVTTYENVDVEDRTYAIWFQNANWKITTDIPNAYYRQWWKDAILFPARGGTYSIYFEKVEGLEQNQVVYSSDMSSIIPASSNATSNALSTSRTLSANSPRKLAAASPRLASNGASGSSGSKKFYDSAVNGTGDLAFTAIQAKDLPVGAVPATDVDGYEFVVSGNGTYTWSNLPAVDESGNLIYYYVVEKDATANADRMSVRYAYEYNTPGDPASGIRKVTITNSTEKDAPTTGSLTVTKSVSGDNAKGTYSIAVKGSDGHYYDIDGTDKGTNAFYVTFNKGDSKTWNNLPAGSYTVEEADANAEGYTWSVSGTGVVDVQAGGTASKTVTNTYTPKPGALVITKKVQFNGAEATSDAQKAMLNKSFKFAVKNSAGQAINGSPFTIAVTNGVSNTIPVADLPEGDYTIEEIDSNGLTLTGATGGKSVSGKVVTVHVAKGKNTEASVEATAKAEFTNNKPYTTAHPQVTKAVTAAGYGTDVRWPDGVDFDFVLSFVSAKDGETNINFSMADQTKTASKANKTAVFEDIAFTEPGVYTFTITEQKPQNAPAYITYDTTPKMVTVTVTADDNGNLTPAISYGGADTLTVNNEYTATGTAQLSAQKAANNLLGNRTFQFQLLDGNDGLLQTSTAVTQGQTATFDAIPYDLSKLTVTENGNRTGTFTYKIKEVIPEDAETVNGHKVKDGVTYDDTVYTVTVTVTDTGNGTLDVKYDNSNTFTVPAFNNTYSATGSVGFEAEKVFTNGDLGKHPFTFKLTQVTADQSTTQATQKVKLNGTETQITDAASGTTDTVTFNTITFTKNSSVDDTGEYWFLLEEQLPDGVTAENPIKDGIKYDTHKKWIEVTVADAGDGTLTVTKAPDADSATGVDDTWTNEQLGELQITKNITVNGEIDPSRTGTFWYAIYKSEAVENKAPKKDTSGKIIVSPAKDAEGKSLVGSITVAKDGTETVTVDKLPYGDYYVFELTGEPTNGDVNVKLIVSGANGVDAAIGGTVYHVTESGTTKATVGSSAGSASLNNTVPETSITGQKTWVPYTGGDARKNPVNTTLTLTLTRYTVSEDENGNKEYDGETTVGTVTISTDADGVITKSDGTNTTTVTLPGVDKPDYADAYTAAWSYTWNDLPLYGDSTDVRYVYRVTETVTNDWFFRKDGENSDYLPKAGTNGGEITTQQFTNIERSPVSLPATGGMGTGIIYGAGAALVLLAVLGMILTKRKRTDGEGIR